MQHQHQTAVPPPLPPGWIVATDPVSGRIYYANPTTGQTSWDPPAVIPPPPPPRPPPPPHPSVIPSPSSVTLHHPYAPSNQTSNIPSVSVVAMNTTLNASGLLIPSARAIINKANTSISATSSDNPTETKPVPVELHMTGGMIADLAKVQSNHRYDTMEENGTIGEMSREDVDKKYRYEPLKPFELPVASTVPHVEGGRVDIRLMTLMDTLNKIQNEKR